MNKKGIILLLVSTLGITSFFTTPQALATSIPTSNELEVNENENVGIIVEAEKVSSERLKSVSQEQHMEKTNITDVEKSLAGIGHYTYDKFYSGQIFTYKGKKYKADDKPISVKVAGFKPIKSSSDILGITNNYSKTEFIGENTFSNKTNQEQTFQTSEYSKTVKEETTSSVSKGYSLGESLNFKVSFKLPGLDASAGTTISTEYHSDQTTSKTHSEEKTLVASSQSVNVPANSVYKADVVFRQVDYSADLGFNSLIQSQNIETIYHATEVETGQLWEFRSSVQAGYAAGFLFDKELENLNLEIAGSPEENRFYVKGNAKVHGSTGAELLVKIYDVTNASEEKLVMEIPLN